MTADLIQRLRFLASGQDDVRSQALTEAANALERTSSPAEGDATRRGLLPCPFCGRRPVLTVRPDNAEATSYFAAVACFCDGYAACAHKDATASEADEAERLAREKWNCRAAKPQPKGTQPVELPAGLSRSDAEFWLRKRGEIIDALRAEGLTMVTTLNGVRFMRLGKIEAQSATQAPAPTPDDKALTQALEERDAASDYIDALLDEVLGKDRHEWTSNYGHADAMAEVRERMATVEGLEKAVAAGFPVVARWTSAAQDAGPKARIWVQFVEGGAEVEFAPAQPAAQAEPTAREFTNELGNAIRITIEGPTSTSENILTPMEAAKLRGALDEHAAVALEAENKALRAQVAALSREAWEWSKALEAQIAAPAVAHERCESCDYTEGWEEGNKAAKAELSGFGWSAVLWSKERGSAMFASRPCDSESNAEGCAALWRKAYDQALFDVTVSPVFIKLPSTSDVPVQHTEAQR